MCWRAATRSTRGSIVNQPYRASEPTYVQPHAACRQCHPTAAGYPSPTVAAARVHCLISNCRSLLILGWALLGISTLKSALVPLHSNSLTARWRRSQGLLSSSIHRKIGHLLCCIVCPRTGSVVFPKARNSSSFSMREPVGLVFLAPFNTLCSFFLMLQQILLFLVFMLQALMSPFCVQSF